jgi:hypothetical protein
MGVRAGRGTGVDSKTDTNLADTRRPLLAFSNPINMGAIDVIRKKIMRAIDDR